MIDAIHKIVSWATSPFGVMFIGLGFAWMIRRRMILSRVCTISILIVVWVLGCGITTRLIGLPLEMEEVDVEVEVEKRGVGVDGGVGVGVDEGVGVGGGVGGEGRPVDAIVLLGGGIGIHKKCGRAELFGAADRAWLAARLWKSFSRLEHGESTDGPLLTVSGKGAPAELMFLADLGVNTNDVLNLSKAKNTEDEARLIKAALRNVGVGGERRPHILLVSSAWHLPRARVLFERAGFDVTPAPTDFEMHFAAEEPIRIGDFFPNAETLGRNSYALKEWVARFCYWIKR